MSVLITSVLNCASDRLAISSLLSWIISGALSDLSFGPFFSFLSWRVCYFKGRSLRCSLGQGNAGRCPVTLYMGEGPRGSNGAAPLSTGLQSFTPLPTIKLGPSGAGSRVGGLVHALGPCGSPQRPLLWGWEFLLLLPQPLRVFSIRGLRLYFPALEPWVTGSALLPAVCPVYLCSNVGPQGLLVVRLPALFVPHSASLGPATAMRVLSALAARLRPSYQSGWKFIFYLLGVGFPCRSIFRQFWLCEEAQCVYLRRHLGSPQVVKYWEILKYDIVY